MNLGKCCSCLDEAIAAKAPVDLAAIAEAVVLAPFVIANPQGVIVIPLAFCLKHRQQQLGAIANGRLVIPR